MLKKRKGNWVTYKDIDIVRKSVELIEDKFNKHLEKEYMGDIRMGQIEAKLEIYNREISHLNESINNQWHRFDEMGERINDMSKNIKEILFKMSK